jgi:hypothetical protein
MISSEVQRTLVKSPPELWAELSDQATLARHLGEFGEIRITRIEPEQAVEWEAQDISGTVLLKPSGWGTKVTLTVTGAIPEPQPQTAPGSPADGEPAGHAEPGATVQAEFESTMHRAFHGAEHVEPEPCAQPQFEHETHVEPEPCAEPQFEHETHVEPEPLAQPQLEHETHVEPEPLAQADPEPPYALEIEYRQAVAVEPAEAFDPWPARATRRSFFAKLFRRRRPSEEAAEPESREPIAIVEEPPWVPGSPEPLMVVEPVEPEAPIEVDESVEGAVGKPLDISAELRAAEQATAAQVTAVLTAVLDRLGAAHHRPFSRA